MLPPAPLSYGSAAGYVDIAYRRLFFVTTATDGGRIDQLLRDSDF
jgi:hypothetical protein